MKNTVWVAIVMATVTAIVNAGEQQKSSLSYEEELSIRREAAEAVAELNARSLSPQQVIFEALTELCDQHNEDETNKCSSPKVVVKEVMALIPPSPLALTRRISASPKMRPIAVRIAAH
ncbi:MAG: hypothetical protein ACHQVS_00950 [Candidatus Babeliales bacterium]